MPAARETTRAFRVAAAALASSPVGFAAGALLAARNPAEPISMDGLTVLGYGLAGASIAALIMALAALTLPPKPVRIATLVAAGASFAILVYMVQDFIRDSIAQSDAVSAAYASMPHYELTLWAKDPRREAFSRFTLDFETRRYTATRPGAWLCQGAVGTEQVVALFEAMQTLRLEQRAACGLRASWRTIADAAGTDTHGCVAFDNALFAVADDMVEATERKASCRRTDAK